MTSSAVLLEALETFLRDELSQRLGPYESYQCRIAANLLALLRREQVLGPLLSTLDRDFARAHGLDAASMPGALALALRDGTVAESATVRDYLRRRSLLSLAIDNPRYSGYRQGRDAWPELAGTMDTQIAAVSGDPNDPPT